MQAAERKEGSYVVAVPTTGAVSAYLIGDDFKKIGGACKWSGIALAGNGKFYCSPFTCPRVLRIDPATEATKLIGDEGATEPESGGNIRWSGIAAAADGKLYCSPHNATRVLRIDPATDAAELIGDDLSALEGTEDYHRSHSPGNMWSGIAAAADGKLYCSPRNASRVLRIDPATGATELIGDDLKDISHKGGFGGIAAAADGKLYCYPNPDPRYSGSRVLRIDPATGATELIGDDLKEKCQVGVQAGISGIVAAADGKLYCLPQDTKNSSQDWKSRLLRIDPATGATELFGDEFPVSHPVSAPSGMWRWRLAGEVDGQLYCMPSDATCVLRIDLATGKSEVIGKILVKDQSDWCGFAAAADGTLYCAPDESTRVLRIAIGSPAELLRKAPCSGRCPGFKPKRSNGPLASYCINCGQHIDRCTVGIN